MPQKIRKNGKAKYIEIGENKNTRRKGEVKEETKEEKWLEGRRDEIVNIVATTREAKCIYSYVSTTMFCAHLESTTFFPLHIRIHDIVPFTPGNQRQCSFHT
jgi:hypothetical protein